MAIEMVTLVIFCATHPIILYKSPKPSSHMRTGQQTLEIQSNYHGSANTVESQTHMKNRPCHLQKFLQNGLPRQVEQFFIKIYHAERKMSKDIELDRAGIIARLTSFCLLFFFCCFFFLVSFTIAAGFLFLRYAFDCCYGAGQTTVSLKSQLA